MSDQTDCINTSNSIDNCNSISCYLPRKRIKLTPNKNRNARSLTDKIQTQSVTNSWDFIDKNETMIAELSGGKLTLWQFLLELLMSDDYSSLIKWTDRNIGEFILIQAEEVAKLWGIRKDRNHRMNYDKLSRALRYYYQKNIIKKVHGHKFVYRFVSLMPESIIAATGGGSSHKAITSGHFDLSPKVEPNMAASDGDIKSPDNSSPTPSVNRSPMPNLFRLASKSAKKPDFNSTLTALFQAALLSLSGSNPEMSTAMFANHNNKPTETRSCSPPDNHIKPETNDLSNSRLFDLSGQTSSHECICKPSDMPILPTSSGLYFPATAGPGSSIPIPPFDRQSMLHFSRHSINMQRLSQEILLNATSKSRFNASINASNTPLESTGNSSHDHSNHAYWLNQFAHDLCKSTITNSQLQHQPPPPAVDDSKDSPDPAIKSETTLEPTSSHSDNDEPNSLTVLFQKFVKEFEKKISDSESLSSNNQSHNYSNADLANLIKSQLSSHSSFVWMPVPMNFAAEIMDFCVRSSTNDQ